MLLRRNGEPFPPYREKIYKYDYVREKKQVVTLFVDFINLNKVANWSILIRSVKVFKKFFTLL